MKLKRLELKLEQTEKENNNHISLIKTCIVAFVVYVFLNKIIDKVFMRCIVVMCNNCTILVMMQYEMKSLIGSLKRRVKQYCCQNPCWQAAPAPAPAALLPELLLSVLLLQCYCCIVAATNTTAVLEAATMQEALALQ